MNNTSSNIVDPPVAIVLVNWNSWRDSIECVDSLLAQEYADFHIFLVDNASSDRSVECIRDWCAQPRAEPAWRRHTSVGRFTDSATLQPVPYRIAEQGTQSLPAAPPGCRLTIVRSRGNLGFAGGCNVGIHAAGLAGFAYFWLLNNDTVVQREALSALVRRAGQHARIGMVGSTVRYYEAPDIVQAMGGARMNPATATTRHIGEGRGIDEIPADGATVEEQMSYVFGASMLVSGALIRDIGPMQEDYFLYYEEIDWAIRARDRFSLGYAPASHVFHKSGASSSKVMPAFSANFYYRNRLRFMSRFFPGSLPVVKRRLVVELLYHVAKGHWSIARIIASILWNARRIAAQARSEPGRA